MMEKSNVILFPIKKSSKVVKQLKKGLEQQQKVNKQRSALDEQRLRILDLMWNDD